MGSHPRPKVSKKPQELPRKQKRKPKMCNAQQQSPPQNTAWQGVYPDLSALNELFSTQQATAANAGQPSPWIGFLASLGLQPISGGQTPQQQQARPEQEPSAPPAPEPERHEGQAYAGTNSAAWCQPQHQPSPGASQQPRGHSCGYSCGAPHISQLLQTITNRLLHFSSVATRASVTFFCLIAFLSSLPGFLIQSALYVVLPPLFSASPCPPCLQATCSTPPSPSSILSAPSSSSCPACTSSMCEASPWEILLAGVSVSLGPTQLGTKM